jgi:hypothetical protein
MKRFFLLFSFIALSFNLFACQNDSIIINLFTEKLLAVEKDDKWGYINTKGETKIEFFYDLAGAFLDDVAVVCQNNRFFLINSSGERIIDKTFDFVERDLETGLVWYVSEGKLGLMSAKGVTIVEPTYALTSGPYSASVFAEGLASVTLAGKTGYIDKTGEAVIPLTFDGGNAFYQGRAVVMVGSQYGYIDKNGELVIPANYYTADDFNEMGQAIVSTYDVPSSKETFKVIDKSGADVITGYDSLYETTFGYVGELSDLYYLLNNEGEKVDDIGYDDFNLFFDFILVFREAQDEAKVINKKWETVFSFTEATTPDDAFVDSGVIYFATFNEDKTTDLSFDGDVKPLTCDDISEIVGDKVVAKRYGMYGILSLKNKKLVEFDYDYLSIYDDGYILARINGLYGILNADGKIIIPFEYDSCTISVHLNV